MKVNHFFSNDYSQARQRFLDAARTAGATLDCLELDARGPSGEILAIDVACLGSLQPRQVLVHSSGLHGIEGFAGSAIQLQALGEPPSLAADQSLWLVHALNPHGMAWLRRVNEANVDLNRNFPSPGQRWQGSPEAYRKMDGLLNPPSPPAIDGFLLKTAIKILRYGFPALKQAVAAGQYEYPRGLFYGGNTLQKEPYRYLAWLSRRLAQVEYVLAIDVHTGLGPRARESLFLEALLDKGPLGTLLKSRGFAELPYRIQGGLCASLPGALTCKSLEALTQEFGTYPALRVLHALREENRWHHYGSGSLDHPSKRRLLRMFCPSSQSWRSAILAQGGSLLRQALALLRHRL